MIRPAPQPVSRRQARRFVVTSHKGGAGKTTAAVNIAAAFAELGHRTLLVDVDPQGAAGASLGLGDPPASFQASLYDVILGDVDAAEAIVTTGVENLDLLGADVDLAGAELGLPALPDWQTRLRSALASTDGTYDIVVLDSAPGLGVLPFAALVAADSVLITATPKYLTIRALRHVINTAAQAKAFNPQLEVLGIVPSIVGRRTLQRDEALAELDKRWPGWTLPPLAERVILEEAATAGQPITTYAPRSSSATAVRALAKEVLSRAS